MKAIVFDFDGTLVDSNRLKYDAFFALFPDDKKAQDILHRVLDEMLEQTRQVILRTVLERLGIDKNHLEDRVRQLASRYGDLALDFVKHAPEIPGAADLLKKLSAKYLLFVSSTTPQEALNDILTFWRWTPYFKGIFGHPNNKVQTLADIMKKYALTPGDIMVFGDGGSDETSAQAAGCRFLKAGTPAAFDELLNLVKADAV